MAKLTHVLTLILFATLTATCSANESNTKSHHTCVFTPEKIHLATPKDEDIASTLWQDSMEGYEHVKKLYIIHRNGDVAIIKQQFCSLYKFHVTYLPTVINTPTSLEQVISPIERYRSLAARTDTAEVKAIAEIKQSIIEMNPSFDEFIMQGTDATSAENKFMNYIVTYRPLPYSSDLGAEITYVMSLNQEPDLASD